MYIVGHKNENIVIQSKYNSKSNSLKFNIVYVWI